MTRMLRSCPCPWRVLIFVILLGLPSAPSASATFKLVPEPGNDVRLVIEGQIVAGDLNRIKSTISLSKRSWSSLFIEMNSPGGNVAEAEGIIDYLALYSPFNVTVPASGECLSACFLIFACVAEINGMHGGRNAYTSSRIGVHSARNSNAEDVVSFATDTWVARRYKQCGISDYLIGKMTTTPPSQI
jgi:hypothetical protein